MSRRSTGKTGHRPTRRPSKSRPSAGAETAQRWLKRIIATFGAPAGAVTAIRALWPPPDPEDSARFTAIRVASQVTVGEHALRLETTRPQKFGGTGTLEQPPTDAPASSIPTRSDGEPTSDSLPCEPTGVPPTCVPLPTPSISATPVPTSISSDPTAPSVAQRMSSADEHFMLPDGLGQQQVHDVIGIVATDLPGDCSNPQYLESCALTMACARRS
jgi:hypothetical protein